jgi:hypothetical protein
LTQEVEDLQQQINMLISQQVMAKSASVVEIYANRIAEAGERLEILKANLAQTQVRAETPSQQRARITSFEELLQRGVDYLWTLDERSINQYLHRIFGNLRLVVRDGEIVALELRRR